MNLNFKLKFYKKIVKKINYIKIKEKLYLNLVYFPWLLVYIIWVPVMKLSLKIKLYNKFIKKCICNKINQ